jgi:hypothetical protein
VKKAVAACAIIVAAAAVARTIKGKGKKLRKNKRSRQETAATKTVIMSLCELYCLPGLVSYEKNTGNPISGQQESI